MIGLTYAELKALNPCPERQRAIAKMMGGEKKWNGRTVTAADAVAAGVTFDDLAWAASAVALANKDVERRVRLFLADCAAHVLHIYEREYPADMRVRDCIVASRQFARGEIDEAARAAWAAGAAGAARAARAAGAAGAAEAAGAARAAGAAGAAGAAWAAGAAEREWQLQRLIAWLSDPEPQDWPLPAPQAKQEAA